MIKEHDRIVLERDLPEKKLKADDVGTVVHVYHQEKAFEVELMTLNGETVAIVTLPASQVRAVGKKDITHLNPLERCCSFRDDTFDEINSKK